MPNLQFTPEGHVGIDYGPTGEISVTDPEGNKIIKFGSGFKLPNILTKPAAISDLGHTTAVVHGVIDPAGGGPITGCVVKVVEVGGALLGTWNPLQRDAALPRRLADGGQR